jgi:hypothetical protein
MQEPENWLEIRESHYERNFGPISEPVMHSTDDAQPHIDIYQFCPTGERDYWTLITGGMSNSRQSIPPDAPAQIARRAELMMYVREPKPWMFRVLKELAEYPFKDETFLHWWHTVPNSRPVGSEASLLSAFLFLPPYYEDPETFGRLEIDGDRVDMLWAVPITSAEYDYALENGGNALDELLATAELDPVVDEQRMSLV